LDYKIKIMKKIVSLLFVSLCSMSIAQTYNWTNIAGAPTTGGKQDGIHFISKDTGWVVNGSGKIFKTTNGGLSWLQQKN
jgi:photosystem II stability/assembly factor-like uncharacterized protein